MNKQTKYPIQYKIIEKMDIIRTITELGRQARKEFNIRNRQPLLSIHIPILYQHDNLSFNLENMINGTNYEEIILNELNIKYIDYIDDFNAFELKYKVDFRKLAQYDKTLVKEYTDKVKNNDLETLNKEFLIEEYSSFKGKKTFYRDGIVLSLNTTLNDWLIREGIINDYIREIQDYRKNNNFNITDIVDYKNSIFDLTNKEKLKIEQETNVKLL